MMLMDLFNLKPRQPDLSSKESEKETARRIVSRLAEGNLRLQMGRYLTADDLERQRNRLRQIRFRPVS